MKNVLILGAVGALSYLSYNQFFRYEFYEGTWVSNKEMTLQSMSRVKGMPSKASDALESLLGKMVVHFEDGQMEYYFKDDPSDVTKQPITFEVVSPSKVRFTTYDHFSGKDETTEILFTNGCYSLEFPKWKFREFFCRESWF